MTDSRLLLHPTRLGENEGCIDAALGPSEGLAIPARHGPLRKGAWGTREGPSGLRTDVVAAKHQGKEGSSSSRMTHTCQQCLTWMFSGRCLAHDAVQAHLIFSRIRASVQHF